MHFVFSIKTVGLITRSSHRHLKRAMSDAAHRQLLQGDERIAQLKLIPLWTKPDGERDCIHRKFSFKNFEVAFGKFMTPVGAEAERIDHHPEWFNVYNRVEVTLATHTCNGISMMDIDMALFMDSLDKELSTEKESPTKKSK